MVCKGKKLSGFEYPSQRRSQGGHCVPEKLEDLQKLDTDKTNLEALVENGIAPMQMISSLRLKSRTWKRLVILPRGNDLDGGVDGQVGQLLKLVSQELVVLVVSTSWDKFSSRG